MIKQTARVAVILACAGVTAFFFAYPKTVRDEGAVPLPLFVERVAEELGDAAPPTPAEEAGEKIVVPILVYHGVRDTLPSEAAAVRHYNVSPATLFRQLEFLKWNGYTPITFHDLVLALDERTVLPQKPVIITFDDGWQDQYQNAFPELKELGLSATFFIFTNGIDKNHFMTWPELKEMAAAGMTIGSHTVSHPYLPNLPLDAAIKEITDSKGILEAGLGETVSVFAYPFGHYNDALVAAVKAAGYEAARSTYPGTAHTSADRFTLRSIEVTNDFSQFEKSLP